MLPAYKLEYKTTEELIRRLILLMYLGKNEEERDRDILSEMWYMVAKGNRIPEGLIVKFPDRKYDRCNHSRHSRHILKLKYCITKSFMVKNINIVNVGIVVIMQMDSGKTFAACINLPQEEQKKIIQNEQYWIGRYVEVQFIDYTDKGTTKYAKTQMVERIDEVI